MAKWGKFDYREFEAFAKRVKSLTDGVVLDEFIQEFLLEMALRAQRKIKRRTPVGQDTPTPGNLRRNWKVGNVEKISDGYQIEVYNTVHYAPYVEYGHRAGKDLTKWVEGRFMMTISMQQIERELPKYLEKRMNKLLNDLINGK